MRVIFETHYICKPIELEENIDNGGEFLTSRKKIRAMILLPHRAIILFLFISIDSLLLSSQTISISGKVIDADSKERLPYASVMIMGTKQGGQTNLQGFFIIHNVPDTAFVLQVAYMGYVTNEIMIDPNNDNKEIVISLKQSAINVEGVTVSAEQSSFIKTEKIIGLTTISPTQISTLPSIGQADIFRSIELLPGISATSDASSDLYVQGGTPDENLILFDGMTVYQVDHFFGFFSAFNPDAIKDVQMYQGGFPAKYGGRLSSVIDIVGKTGNPDELHGTAGLSLLSGNASLNGPLLGGTFYLAARRSYSDIIASSEYNTLYKLLTGSSAPTSSTTPSGYGRFGGNGISEQQTPSSDFYDLNANLTYNFTSHYLLSLSYYGSGDNYDLKQQSSIQNISGFRSSVALPSNSNNTTQGNNGTSANFFAQWNDNAYSNFIVAYNNYTSNYTSARGTTRSNGSQFSTNENNNTDDFSVINYNDWKPNSYHDISLGLQFSETKALYSLAGNQETGGTSNLLNLAQHAWESAGYLQEQLSLLENLTLTGGLRLENYSSTHSWFIEPRFSTNVQLTDNISLKAAFGVYHQFVNRIVNEDVTDGSRDFWVLADTSIPISSALHYILGATWQNDGYVFDIEGFYKTLNNISEFTQRFQRNDFEPYTFMIGNERIRGIQMLLQKKVGLFTGWISYTLMKAEARFPQLNDDQYFAADNDQTHELKVIGNYNLGANWNISATFIFATGKPYTAPISQYLPCSA